MSLEPSLSHPRQLKSVGPVSRAAHTASALALVSALGCGANDSRSPDPRNDDVGGTSAGGSTQHFSGSGGKSNQSGGKSAGGASSVGQGGFSAQAGNDGEGGASGAPNSQAGSAGESGSPNAGAGGTNEPPANTYDDPRDGQRYPTVTIESQTWLAKNLNYKIDGSSFCYDDDPQNCDKYGRLYLFSVARTACPPSFRLGSDDDWKTLEAALGMSASDLNVNGYSAERGSNQGARLRAGGDTGFNALPAGFRAGPGQYDALNDRTYFWTSTSSGDVVWRRRITTSSPIIYRFTNPPASFGISVRCVRD